MSRTVSIPANSPFSLSHRGADTTPEMAIRVGPSIGRNARAIEQETLQSLLHVELDIKNDEPEGDREHVVDGSAFVKVIRSRSGVRGKTRYF